MYEVLTYLSAWSVVLPLIVGAVRIRQLDTDSKLIFSLIIMATIPQMIHVYSPRSTEEVISYNLYTIAEFVIYFFLFRFKIPARSWRISLSILFLLYSLISIGFSYRDGVVNRFINELAVSNGIICLVIIGYYLYHTLLRDQGDLTPAKPFFWFTVGILLYAACTTLVYSLWQHILSNPNTVMESLWNLQNVFNIVTYLLFTAGLLVNSGTKHNNNPIPTALN
jgi:hypothetical protein